MAQKEEPRVLDAAQATAWLWETCERLEAMATAGYFALKDALPKDALYAWISEKQTRSLIANAEKRTAAVMKRRREVLQQLSEEDRLAIGYPQRLSQNPNYPIYHVAERQNPDQDTAAP